MPSNMIYKLTCVTETHIYHALYDSALARVMIVIAYHSIQHLTVHAPLTMLLMGFEPIHLH